MRINFLLFLMTIIFIGCEESSEELKNNMYFNQQPPGDTAVVFAPGIISTINHEHSRITFSKDGLEMYWAVILVDTNYKTTGSSPFLLDEQNIWQSKLVNGKWTDPALFEFTKNSSGSSPAFSADGNAFFYILICKYLTIINV